MAMSPQTPPETQDPQFKDDEEPEFGLPVVEKTEEEIEAESKKTIDDLAQLGATLDKKFRECEQKRINIEDRWLEDLRQYHGRYEPGIERDLADAESCTLYLNITKPKTHAFSARVMDMVLPTDEKNWGLEHTPVPEMSPGITPDEQAEDPANPGQPMSTPQGQPILQKDMAQAVSDEAKERATAMEDEIDDQLEEGEYNALQRQTIEQMSKLGTSVLMGPVITDEWKVEWVPHPVQTPPNPDGTMQAAAQKNVWERKLVPNTERRPGVQWVDVWNFYPDMSANNPKEWGFAFVQYLVNEHTLRRMAKQYGFIESQTKMAIDTTPFNVSTLRWMNELRSLSETMNFVDNRYRLLRYYGEIDPEDLRAVGLDPDKLGVSDIIYGVVWMCHGVILKVTLNPLDSGEMPFSVAYCDKDEASPFGRGIPRLMRGEQDSVNAAWRMMHDNAGLSVGPQTVVKLNSVTPADGDYHLKPRKMWYAADDVANVNAIFGQFAIDSHQSELSNILQMGIKFADDVTQLPLLMQGDQAPHITQTAQGMSLLYNASTVVLRRSIKFYDDYVTVPMISRFYQWNMQFNPKDDIKGDFRIIARGSSTLLDKEQQGQAYDAAMQLAMQPTWQPYTDMEKLYREALKGKKIPDIVLPADKIASNLKAQQDQAAAAAQQQSAGKGGAAPPDPQLEARKIAAMEDANRVKREQIASNERIKAAEFAAKEGISQNQALSRLAGIKTAQDAENDRFNKETQTKLAMGSGI